MEEYTSKDRWPVPRPDLRMISSSSVKSSPGSSPSTQPQTKC